jgi:hypothetical protein
MRVLSPVVLSSALGAMKMAEAKNLQCRHIETEPVRRDDLRGHGLVFHEVE